MRKFMHIKEIIKAEEDAIAAIVNGLGIAEEAVLNLDEGFEVYNSREEIAIGIHEEDSAGVWLLVITESSNYTYNPELSFKENLVEAIIADAISEGGVIITA